MPIRLSILSVALFALPVVAADPPKPVDFAHDVVPILRANCAKCHTNGTYKGSVSFDTRPDLVKKAAVPGKAASSEMIRRVTSNDPDERMPPKGPRLADRDVQTLRAWIDQGAAWEPGFSFKARTYVAPLRPRRPEIPAGNGHPIDRILAKYFADHTVTPPPPLDDAAFARRVYLDLIGLLPAPSELDAFLADAAPDKRAALVRRLLDDGRAYADHWMAFWNDLLRNEYKGTGYIDGGRKQITGWLYQSLLDNKPYNR